MKKIVVVLCFVAFFSCTKKDVIETSSTAAYQIRIAAIDNNGTKSFTPITRVKSGKVAVEFETAEVSNLKEYQVEVSVDGFNFKSIKTIAADLQSPDKTYRDTVVLE